MASAGDLFGGGSKQLILPRVSSGGNNSSPAQVSVLLPDSIKIPLYLPNITNAAMDFSSSASISLGFRGDANNTSPYKGVVCEHLFRNFTINTSHQITLPNETITVIRATNTITIGGNGMAGVGSVSQMTSFLEYPYNHGAATLGAVGGIGAGGSGSAAAGAPQPQRDGGTGFPANVANGGGAAAGFSLAGLQGTNMRTALVLVAKNIIINGNITLNGGNATVGAADEGHGGGHGGYCYLVAENITYTSGTINVSGGNGSAAGGSSGNCSGGGGGYCGLIFAHAKAFSGSGTTITANVGTGGAGNGSGFAGGAGGFPLPAHNTGYLRLEGNPFS